MKCLYGDIFFITCITVTLTFSYQPGNWTWFICCFWIGKITLSCVACCRGYRGVDWASDYTHRYGSGLERYRFTMQASSKKEHAYAVMLQQPYSIHTGCHEKNNNKLKSTHLEFLTCNTIWLVSTLDIRFRYLLWFDCWLGWCYWRRHSQLIIWHCRYGVACKKVSCLLESDRSLFK
jgi:hypothetical protein